MIPMLTLGIPGDGATAIMLGALMVQGMQPGPLLFQNQAPQVYTIFLGLLAANFFMGLFGFSAIRLFVKVINIPKKYLMPIIFPMTFVGAFAYNNSITDVFVMVGFGFLGYFLNKMEFSMSAIVIGIILGSMAESNFRGALMMSDGSLMIFLTHPICAVFLLIALISLLARSHSQKAEGGRCPQALRSPTEFPGSPCNFSEIVIQSSLSKINTRGGALTC